MNSNPKLNILQEHLQGSLDLLEKSIDELRIARSLCWANPKLDPARESISELALQLMTLHNQLDLSTEELEFFFEHFDEMEIANEGN